MSRKDYYCFYIKKRFKNRSSGLRYLLRVYFRSLHVNGINKRTKELARHVASLAIPSLHKEICNICLTDVACTRHHFDYSKPMDVLLLCKGCHEKIHAKTG